MRLTKYEQETIINFNQGENTAYLYTCSKTWMQHLERKIGLKPAKKYGLYAKEYELPKAWIRKPLKPRRLSEKQKRDLTERLLQKSILSEKTPYGVGNFRGQNVR